MASQSYVGGSSANSTTTSLPAGAQAGDLALVLSKAGSATPPTLVSGWKSLGTGSGSASQSTRVAEKVLTAADIAAGNVGTWTNSQTTLVVVYRDAICVGAISGTHANSNTVTFPARSGLTSTSWQVALGNHNTQSVKSGAVTNYTNRSTGFTATTSGAWDSNGTTTGLGQQTLGVGGASGNSGWTMELRAATAYVDMVKTLAPTGFWPLDDSSGNCRDATLGERPGTVSGTITTYRQTGPTINSVAQVAMTWGASGKFAIPATVDDDVVQFTAAIWFKTSNTATGTGLMGQYAGGTNAQSSWLMYKQSGASSHIACFVYSGAAEATVYPETSTGYADGAWHLAVAWRDSGGVFHVRVDDTTQVDATPDVTWKGAVTQTLNIGSDGGTWVGDLALAAYWKTDIGVAKRSALFSGVYTEVERGNPPFDVLQAVARAGSW